MKESIKVLNECIDLQTKKSNDYQNPNSNVVQAMHYRRGIDSIHDIIQGKVYRAQSLLEAAVHDTPNYESLEDTYKDIINYCSFAVSWLRFKMEGQNQFRDIFNKRLEPSNLYFTDSEPSPYSSIEDEHLYLETKCKSKNPNVMCTDCDCWKMTRLSCG
jgi:hypothetical protein